MSKENNGGPAFPVPIATHKVFGTVSSDFKGMSLRDYFAVKAMQGLLCNSEVERYRQTIDGRVSESRQIEAISQMCYEIADAMLKAREE